MEINALAERVIKFSQKEARKTSKHSARVNCPLPYRYDIHELPNGLRISIGTTEHLYFDRLHRSDILRNLNKVAGEYLANLDRIFWRYRRIEAFNRWKSILAAARKYSLKKRSDEAFDNSCINKRTTALGAKVILRILIIALKERVAASFYHWLSWITYRRRVLGRFFDKWNVKASRIALNRMNARRFLYILKYVGKKYRYFMLLQGWRQLRDKIEWWRLMKRLRLWFRCWKTVVKAMIEGRKRRAKRVLRVWREESRLKKEFLLVSEYIIMSYISFV
jgi:hypothetical protein